MRWPAVAVVLAGVAVASIVWLLDSRSDSNYPEVVNPTRRSVAGVVNGPDGPLSGVAMAIGIDDQRFNGDGVSTRTDESGGFIMEIPESFVDAGDSLFLEVALTSPTSGESLSTVRVRRPLTAGELRHDVEVSVPRPCADACDLLLPDLTPVVDGVDMATDPLPPASVMIDDGDTFADRRLLRFASLTANIGEGPLHVLGAGIGADGQLSTEQRLWTRDLRFEDRDAGAFVFHPGHDHIHLEEFEAYRLLDLSGRVVAESGKVSFCLRDSAAVDSAGTASIDFGIFLGQECGIVEQAINPGFADYYGADLPDQWIDITGVEPGDYRIEIVADPADLLAESDETNNSISFPVEIP